MSGKERPPGNGETEKRNKNKERKKNGELPGDRLSVFLPLICSHSPPV